MKIIDHHESTRNALIDKAKLIRQHTSQEVAGALGWTDWVTSKIEKFEDQKQTSGSVAISGEAQQEAKENLEEQGKEYQGMFHTHIESLGHGHEPSAQDKETFKQHEVNEIAFLREDGTIDIKAYNKNGEQIEQTINGKTAKVISIAADDTINTLQQAA
jgi:proteasome lid subunit RPN8/RPN11